MTRAEDAARPLCPVQEVMVAEKEANERSVDDRSVARAFELHTAVEFQLSWIGLGACRAHRGVWRPAQGDPVERCGQQPAPRAAVPTLMRACILPAPRWCDCGNPISAARGRDFFRAARKR